MAHIRQINSTPTCYTVVKTEDWEQELHEHPSIVNRPDVFEISVDEIPPNAQYLDYDEYIED
jgi:hypothetical protein